MTFGDSPPVQDLRMCDLGTVGDGRSKEFVEASWSEVLRDHTVR